MPGTRFNSILSSDAKECQQAFMAPLSGKVARQEGSIDKLILIDVIEITIDLCLDRLTLVLSTFISYAGQCMIGFDLLTNYVDDLEALIRRTRAKLKKVLALESEDN